MSARRRPGARRPSQGRQARRRARTRPSGAGRGRGPSRPAPSTGHGPRQRLVRRATLALIVLVLVGMVLAMAGTALAAPADSAPGGAAAPPSAAPAGSAAGAPPLVLVATTGLTWQDVAAGAQAGDATSARMLTMAATGEPANLVQRTVGDVTCPADAWLTLSSGARTRSTEPTGQAGACPWPTWQQARAAAASSGYTATPGALADALARGGQSALAVGRGAELALTSSEGTAPSTARTLAEAVDAGLPDVTLVDASAPGDLTAALDALAGRDNVLVVVASIADPTDPGLQMLLLPAGTFGWGGLAPVASPSTRQTGIVQLTDLAPTLLRARGTAVPASMTGSGMALGLGAPVPSADSRGAGRTVPQEVGVLIDSAQRAHASRAVGPLVSAALVLTCLTATAAGAVALRGPGGRRRLRGVLTASLLAGWAPVGVWASVLVPWWRLVGQGRPGAVVLVPVVLAVSAVMTAAFAGAAAGTMWAAGRVYRLQIDRGRRRRPAGGIPGTTGMLALITPMCVAILMIADAACGAPMGFAGATGMDPILAGRFYGLSNTGFAIAGAATLISVALVTTPAALTHEEERLRRRAAALGVCAPGAVAVAAIGVPGAGTDVGGALTLTVALAVLAMALAGVRLGWRRILVAGAGGVAVVAALGVVDYATGPRTHMGRFVAGLGDGSAMTTLARKATALAAPFVASPLTAALVVVGAVAAGALAWWVRRELRAWREGRSAYRPLLEAGQGPASPETASGADRAGPVPVWFGAALGAIGVLAVVETLVNDSGLSMPALTVATSAPLLLAITCARLLEGPSALWADGAADDRVRSSASH